MAGGAIFDDEVVVDWRARALSVGNGLALRTGGEEEQRQAE
jgi:hypothetical protein